MRRKLTTPFLAVFELAAAAPTPPCASADGVGLVPSFGTEEAIRRPARSR
ncbi:MAG TPA: hypothetical protein VIP46_13990 [Pyrinomonadaceae bacterium]